MQINCSTCSVILNMTATQYTCSLNGIYPPSLTSAVMSSLFTHAHSTPFSLAAKLHRYHANCSHYINNGWNFCRQTSYTFIQVMEKESGTAHFGSWTTKKVLKVCD